MDNLTHEYVSGEYNLTGYEGLPEYELWGWWVREILTPIIVFVGIVGNAMSFMVMKSKALRSKSYSHYLCALAVFDSLTLIGRLVDVVNEFVKYKGHPSIFANFSDEWCKVYKFCEHVCYLMSSWLIVVMAFERIVAVFFPFRKTAICNQRVGVSLIFAMVIVLSISQVFRPIMVIIDPDYQMCSAAVEHTMIYIKLHTYLYQLCLVLILPAFLVLMCNGFILCKIHEIRKATEDYSGVIITTTTTSRVTHSGYRQHKTTFMLLVISFSYVLFTLPLIFLTVLILLKTKPDYESAKFMIIIKPYSDVFSALSDVNYGINFFLYVISGKSFRRELRKMFSGKRRPIFSSIRTRETNSRAGQ